MNRAKTLLAPALTIWLALSASTGQLLAQPLDEGFDEGLDEPRVAGPEKAEEEWESRPPGPAGRGPFAHGRHGFPGAGPIGPGGLMPALHRLDLSEDQREQIRDVLEQERELAEGYREQMRALRAELEDQIESDPFDENAVRAKAEAVAALGADMAVLRARRSGQIRELLTSEQLSELEELKAKRESFREQRRGRFGPRRGPRTGS